MINQNGNNVPENKIALIYNDIENGINFESISKTVKKPDRKRDWFEPFFYNCLPIVIGNQYGFIITAEFGFNVIWNGGNNKDDIHITYIIPEDFNQDKTPILNVASNFGNGIISITLPTIFRTPPGVNIMTINPPNYIIKNVTVLSGVVETDNARVPFTFNIRLHEPNILTSFPKGTPLSGFIPIPRGFADKFELVDGEEVFGEKIFNEELETFFLHETRRSLQSSDPDEEFNKPDRYYFDGMDILGNKFPEHQTPNGKIVKPTTYQ